MLVNIKTALVTMLGVCVLLTGCKADSGEQVNRLSMNSDTANQNGKPIVLIIIDSIMDKPLSKTIQEGNAPALQYLIQNGKYYPNVISSFPTMSVTIDSTLMTGAYADKHHVPGLVWFDSKEKRMVFYGSGVKESLKIDQPQVLMDAIYQLNHIHLGKQIKTIHEELADKGMESASINAVVFRGYTEHTFNLPQWIAHSGGLPEQLKVTGPKWLSYATFAQQDPNNNPNTRPWKKFGMNDDFTAQEAVYLIKQRQLPKLTLAYFPENDKPVHSKGPDELSGIRNADQALQTIFSAYGTWEQALKDVIWIVIGDSAQSYVYDKREESIIDLRLLLKYRIAHLNQPVSTGDQIVIAANERMAYVYAIDDKVDLTEVMDQLKNEQRLDIIAMKNENEVRVTQGNSEKMFSYAPGGKYLDEFGQAWTLSGDHEVLDITIADNRIQYGRYPDALARLYGAINSHEGRYVVVTVQPGYELVGESSPTHAGGGAHGSLHDADSLVPLIFSGTDIEPGTMRIVDIKDWILRLVNG
ncbi:MAG: phosphodiesterase [Paenibacillaceae bacterium]|nr:phosphodiesterase [Paenibacillaceae bacterium]